MFEKGQHVRVRAPGHAKDGEDGVILRRAGGYPEGWYVRIGYQDYIFGPAEIVALTNTPRAHFDADAYGYAEPASSGVVFKDCTTDADPYRELSRILALAYDQAAKGKGAERHSNGGDWHEQRTMLIARGTGVGGPVFQVCKKAQEAQHMITRGEHDAAIRELLGVIVYAAFAVKLAEEMKP